MDLHELRDRRSRERLRESAKRLSHEKHCSALVTVNLSGRFCYSRRGCNGSLWTWKSEKHKIGMGVCVACSKMTKMFGLMIVSTEMYFTANRRQKRRLHIYFKKWKLKNWVEFKVDLDDIKVSPMYRWKCNHQYNFKHLLNQISKLKLYCISRKSKDVGASRIFSLPTETRLLYILAISYLHLSSKLFSGGLRRSVTGPVGDISWAWTVNLFPDLSHSL